jgi:Holliday junction resolvase RusA-like endonuclease
VTFWAFTAIGTPASQGSKRHVGGGRMIESSKKLAPWRDTVTNAAFGAGPQLHGPVAARIVFTLPRPKSAPKKETWPQRGLDLDKMVRAVFDAVTAAGLWEDDARVCELSASKAWVGADDALPVPGVIMSCEELDLGPIRRKGLHLLALEQLGAAREKYWGVTSAS